MRAATICEAHSKITEADLDAYPDCHAKPVESSRDRELTVGDEVCGSIGRHGPPPHAARSSHGTHEVAALACRFWWIDAVA